MRSIIFYFFIFFPLLSFSKQLENKIIGAWIASPKHNSFLNSYSEIKESVDVLLSKGINTLYLCVWEDQKTAFKSKVLLENSSYSTLEETSFLVNSTYKSPTNDQIKDLINFAQSKGIKVLFWFEYGFMSKINSIPTAENDPILNKNPHWIALGNDGSPSNYNGTDYYYNSFHPEVQQFVFELVEESLELYPQVDGIQFDDRMPASPVNSGYDQWTINKFASEHFGVKPPDDFNDKDWFNWRINNLNRFSFLLVDKIKSKGNYLVSFSPNIFPWSRQNLMQDWPEWLKNQEIDMINVQCYRTKFKDYKNIIDQVLLQTADIFPKSKISPGLILGVSDSKLISPSVLDSILNYNTKIQIGGQSYFYVKWLLDSSYDEQLTKYNF